MAVNVNVFNVKLKHNIQPTSELREDYTNLPTYNNTTVMDYFRFSQRYGLFLRYGSMYGGKLLVLIYHNKIEGALIIDKDIDAFTLSSIINEAHNKQSDKETKVSKYSEGGIADTSNVST